VAEPQASMTITLVEVAEEAGEALAAEALAAQHPPIPSRMASSKRFFARSTPTVVACMADSFGVS